MHINQHSHHAKTAYTLLIITLIFFGYLLYEFPEIRQSYTRPFTFLTRFLPQPFIQNIHPQVEHIYNPTSAPITEFGTTSDFVLIDETTGISPYLDPLSLSTNTEFSSSTPEETEVEGFIFSPERQWATLYLTILETDFEMLDLDIQYVRIWQQTGGFLRDLKEGSKGQDVALVQYLLSRFEPSFGIKNITSTYGPKTKSSLALLQKKLQLKPTGVFNEETRFFFDAVYFKELCPDADPEQDKTYENVGRRVSVPLDYIPSDLIRLPRTIRSVGVMCLSKEPAKRLEDMFIAAKNAGHDLAVFSAYRSSKTQKLLTQYYLSSLGTAGLAGVAEAGHSEHQLGTTVDISGKSIQYAGPSQKFGNTPEGKWLEQNSYKYGFILSYPQGKQADTGYIYEPWHFRYVGIDTARDIFEEKLTIQEYFNLVKGEGYTLDAESELVPEI